MDERVQTTLANSVCETNIAFGYHIGRKALITLPLTIANWWDNIEYLAKIEKRFYEWQIDTNHMYLDRRCHQFLNWFDRKVGKSIRLIWSSISCVMRMVFKFITYRIEESISMSFVISNLIGRLVYSPTSRWKILSETFHNSNINFPSSTTIQIKYQQRKHNIFYSVY